MKIENIKFKAKRLNDGEWVKGDLVQVILVYVYIIQVTHFLMFQQCIELIQIPSVCLQD